MYKKFFLEMFFVYEAFVLYAEIVKLKRLGGIVTIILFKDSQAIPTYTCR